ncbi:MAG: DNA-directed RNA polymerase subunit RpoH/Rpb5 C-terminal domain-containing protein, partial [Candidatus Aenigmatarchaeota archaeon]
MKSKKSISPPINILEHVYVPKHEILSKEEAEALLKKYNITPSQLPSILISDPVVKAIGAK